MKIIFFILVTRLAYSVDCPSKYKSFEQQNFYQIYDLSKVHPSMSLAMQLHPKIKWIGSPSVFMAKDKTYKIRLTSKKDLFTFYTKDFSYILTAKLNDQYWCGNE